MTWSSKALIKLSLEDSQLRDLCLPSDINCISTIRMSQVVDGYFNELKRINESNIFERLSACQAGSYC